MGRRESYSPKSMDDFYRNIGLDSAELEQPGKTVKEEAETAMADEPSNGEAAVPQKRISSMQYRLSLEEYRTPISKSPRLSTASPCSSAGRYVTNWTGLSATLEEKA